MQGEHGHPCNQRGCPVKVTYLSHRVISLSPHPQPLAEMPGTYVQRQGRIGAEARKAPVASPRLAQTILPGEGAEKQGKSGQGEPPAEQPRARNSARSGL